MEPAEYDRMNAVEDRMWWYRAAHANMLDALRRSPAPPGSPLLDAGCGTGGLLRRLAAANTGRLHVGIDMPRARRDDGPGQERCAGCRGQRRPAAVRRCQHGHNPQRRRDLPSSVEPARALAEALRCLVPGGSLIMNVPAYQWMYSFHDRQVHNARRFDRAGLRRLLTEAGFAQVRITYWNCLLFPLMVLRRKLFAAAGRPKRCRRILRASPTAPSA